MEDKMKAKIDEDETPRIIINGGSGDGRKRIAAAFVDFLSETGNPDLIVEEVRASAH